MTWACSGQLATHQATWRRAVCVPSGSDTVIAGLSNLIKRKIMTHYVLFCTRFSKYAIRAEVITKSLLVI
eukprot:600136-Amphidinium_carterae.1